MTKTLLDIKNLHGGYGGKPVLQGLNFNIQEGEIVAIIGRNGVGKTTLMRSLIGLLECQGQIKFLNEELVGLPPYKRARLGMGYIPQGREVFPAMTVEENLKVGEHLCRPNELPDYDRTYSFFPILKERALQNAATLSGGQQQQLAIGRVMIGKPRLMLLDEPSEGIQPSIVKDIARNIKRLNEETNLAVLFVEQNLDMIIALAQRCYVMDKGRIIGELDIEELHDQEKIRRYLAI